MEKDNDTIQKKVMKAYSLLESANWELNELKEDICDNYCKWPEIVYSMYKDVDDAQRCLETQRCESCPLNKL